MRVLDQRMLSLQRQGRIGFYGTAHGQEAAVTGSAYAARATDWVFPALREMGVALWRGTPVRDIVCQLIGNSGDVLIGRQMPCHFSDRRVRTVAWSSVIGTQLAHAMGAAWAARLRKTGDVMMGYMGDGASSSADFHAAANFAGVFKLPVVFFCQNNQWAISVPLSRQTASDGIADQGGGLRLARRARRRQRPAGGDRGHANRGRARARRRRTDAGRSGHVPHGRTLVERRPDALSRRRAGGGMGAARSARAAARLPGRERLARGRR